MVHVNIAAVLALPLLVFASLPPCGNIDQPCSCPAGATFKNVTTYATIGATAKDIGAVINDFFNTTWFAVVTVSTTGTDNVVGATRTFNLGTNTTTVPFTEELIEYQVEADGSFIQRYRQDTTPAIITLPGGNGSFAGFWENIVVQQTSIGDESSIVYGAYRCDIGNPFDTVKFHEFSINSTIAILTQEGKDTGTNVYPYSTTSFFPTKF